MGKLMYLSGSALKQIRIKRKLKQTDVAVQTGISKDTLSRIERTPGVRVSQERTVTLLCQALGVDAATLAGDKPLTEQGHTPAPERSQLNVRISDAARNAYALTSARYRVTRDQVAAAAPLLFFIVAEQSLRERRRRLAEVSDAAERLETMFSGTPHFPGARLGSEWDVLTLEEKSIKRIDIFGKMIGDGVEDLPEDWDDERNPLAAFVREALTQVSADSTFEAWAWHGEPRYGICRDEAIKFMGGDAEAAEAVLAGTAPLHQMPQEVRKSGPEQRAAWARAKVQESAEEIDRLLAELGDLSDDAPPADQPEGQ